MHLPDLGRLLRLQLTTGLPEQRVDEQPAAHPDAPMDAPDGELNSGALQRLAPREHVLVHAVDERAVEIEEKSGAGIHGAIL